MATITTAERVSREQSDNYVFQRSLLAYHKAAELISGNVLEIGTGEGYGAEILASHATQFITLDKTTPENVYQAANVEFVEAAVPPIPAANNSFDYVVSFQVIEHIKRDFDFVREVHRVLKPGGKFIVTTPNAPMSLTRNPWHVREYRAEELTNILECHFSNVETMGVFGNEKVMEYYEKNRRSVRKITR
ncbi:MAG: class I SAM-dependent methyltransferase, partial [Alistipes sp.]|nr:class I SAM-dependent methyltransferase [Alistipes sp.]